MENYKNSKIGRETAQKYGDILEVERPQTEESLRKHPRMTLQNRAKIFSPFSPLRGYDEQLAAKKAEYAETPAQFYTDYSNAISGSDTVGVLTVPEGYRFCKHILIKKAEEGDTTKNVNQIVEEVKAKLADGVDFDKLVEEYGEDPGMKEEPYKTEGYLISENTLDKYYDGFGIAAISLKNIGDVSNPVETEAGYHFIQYTSDAEVKDTPFEDVKQAITDKLTEDEKVAIYNDCLAKWKEEIKIEKYYDRVSGIK